ncbi:helix-turn-helix domain-containing protein [Streptomyces kaempferi]|uniref:Helix-turn-helix domain-containing protein n=1 Tax=Streptomyces kaempferi TaxID=333725 RepID=A0ABW3XV14_9ACTN
MKVRADIATLIREGHTNTSIAARLHCHESTVAEARRALRYPPADRLTRLYAEAVPTGRTVAPVGRLPLSPAQQAANRNRLLAALKEAA